MTGVEPLSDGGTVGGPVGPDRVRPTSDGSFVGRSIVNGRKVQEGQGRTRAWRRKPGKRRLARQPGWHQGDRFLGRESALQDDAEDHQVNAH
jgi:hypothetical protein